MMEDPFAVEEALPPVPLPPASSVRPILIVDSSYSIGTHTPKASGNSSPCITPTSTRSRPRSEKKKVSFSADTAVPEDNNLALSITKHAYTKEVGYTQYTVEFMYRGIGWSVNKRYRDFEELNRQMILESEITQIVLPILPKKRWFEKQRWLNRFDESYGIKRRVDLQDYMRTLAKMQDLRESSASFQEFLAMPKEAQALQPQDFLRMSVEALVPARPQFRDSMLEVDLNVDFDEEGNAVCPIEPGHTRDRRKEDDEHQIYTIAEDDSSGPTPQRVGDDDSDDEDAPAAAAAAAPESASEELEERAPAAEEPSAADADGSGEEALSTAAVTLKLQGLHSHY